MKNINNIWLFVLLLVALIGSSCSSRIKTPTTNNDSTIVYPAIDSGGINAQITLYRKTSKKSGKLVGEGNVFTIKQKRNIRAKINIDNIIFSDSNPLLFHMDWINPDGESFYNKQVDLIADSDNAIIESSISISPQIREPGNYKLLLYYFRELIAEKNFKILPEVIITPLIGDSITANITLYRKKSKKTHKLIGEGTEFKIKKKRNVKALINITNRFGYGNRELKFIVKWIAVDGSSYYQKRINLPATDSTSALYSSISVSPGKRPPGNYKVQVFLFKKLIGEKSFTLAL